jgi:hypothetical protein
VGFRPLVCLAKLRYYTTASRYKYTLPSGKKQTTEWPFPGLPRLSTQAGQECAHGTGTVVQNRKPEFVLSRLSIELHVEQHPFLLLEGGGIKCLVDFHAPVYQYFTVGAKIAA